MSRSSLVERILSHLRVERGPDKRGEYTCWCPFHPDGKGKPPHEPNLRVSERGFICFACDEKGGLLHLAEHLGIDVASNVAAMEVTYDYQDEQGNLLFQVVRRPGKKFMQRRPDGKGSWIWNLKNTRRVPYRLPELRTRKHESVFITEGEKDADRLRREGILATTNPGGAGKWRDEYSQELQGRDVILTPDNDDAGKRHMEQVARSLQKYAKGIKILDLPDLPEKGDVSDWLAGHRVEDLQELIKKTQLWGASEAGGAGGPGAGIEMNASEDRRSASMATRLIEIVRATSTLFHTPDQTAYADLMIDGHRETWPVRSRVFTRWMAHQFYLQEGKAAGARVFSDVVIALEGDAQFAAPEIPVHTRVASTGDAIYLDLANPIWESIEITTAGWRVMPSPPVRFRRAKGTLALPRPVRGGTGINLLRPFLNVPDDESFYLTVAWLLAALRDRGPYPIAVVQGEQGSTKSTFSRVLRSLVDPVTAPLRRPPKNEHDLVIAAHNSRVLAYDNLSGLSPWLSDALCAVATGGGLSTRELYSDTDEVLFDVMRPIIINGIDDLVIRPDLTDRSVVFLLPQLSDRKRREERGFWKGFQTAHPAIFGVLLDAVSAAQASLSEVRIERLPRMADFAKWAVAAEPALGWNPGAFLDAYVGNRGEAVELGLESDPVATTVRDLVATKGSIEVTPTELWNQLTELVPVEVSRTRSWPKNARSLSNRLRRLAPSFRAVGIGFETGRTTLPGGKKKRVFRIWQMDDRTGETCVPSVPNVPEPEDALLQGNVMRQPGQERWQEDRPDSDPTVAGNARNAGISGLVGDGIQVAPCPSCGDGQLWRSVHDGLFCARCHPPATPELVADWVEASP